MAASPTQGMVRFGLFELDLRAAQLTRNGAKIRLAQQPLQLLAILLESPGDIVTREELRQRLWPSDVFIDFDHSLNKSIQKLRDALGDSADSPRYIETVPRVGYRFIAPVGNETRPPEPEPDIAITQIESETASIDPGAANPRLRWLLLAAGVFTVAAAAGIAFYLFSRLHPPVVKYTQLTDFTDSATAPALSPDGHILAFIRGDRFFGSPSPIYVKMLPDGESRLLTNDPSLKYGLAFSPDGSQIAYSVLEEPSFSTYAISVLGGDPHRLLTNTAGLTWLDPQHLLFSRIRSGLHMGIVTESVSGNDFRELYFPPHERAMAHYSFYSPDRRSAIVVEMNGQGAWSVCQVISLVALSPPRPVGPQGECTAAGWSPDGTWMYFIATVEGQSHLWRQRSPNQTPEQITSGPSDEEGLAIEQNGRSIITSIGVHESAIWIHDSAGERSLSSEGEIVADQSPPTFSADDNTLYYLLRHQKTGPGPELWRMTLDTGKSEAVFPGTSMFAYDVSPDGKQVIYATAVRNGRSQLWLAPIDKSSPARHIGNSGETLPHFGRDGKILFQITEGNANYIEQMNQDGSERSKVLPYPIIELQSISPGRRWLMVIAPYPEGNTLVPGVLAIPLDGGSPRRVCASYCVPRWASNGRFLFVPVEASSQEVPGRSLAIPVGPEESLPELPEGGIKPVADPSVVAGAKSLDRAELVPGADLSHYAYVKTTVHRNLYRVSLPESVWQ